MSEPPLPTRPVGSSGLQVSTLGFGGSTIGNISRAIDDDTAADAVDAAWDAGLRYFDTAPHYGLGLSEQRLGRALAHRPREQYVLSTKVGRLLMPRDHATGSDLQAGGFAVPDDLRRVFDFSRDGVLRSLESSLDRLGTDRVDIVLIHDPDLPEHADQAITRAVPTLLQLRNEGVVGAVGFGMNTCATPLRAVRETDIDVVMIAGRWTLLDRSAATLLDACANEGVAVLAAAPYNSGVLAVDRPGATARYQYQPVRAEVLDRALDLAGRLQAHGVRLPAAAVQFALRHQAVASVVVGMRDAGQVGSTVRAFRTPVPNEAWEAVA